MSFLNSILGGKKNHDAQIAAAAGKPLQSAMRRKPPASKESNVTVLRQPPKAPAQAQSVYRQLSDVPAHSEIASASGAKYALNSRTQETMCVLKLTEAENLFAVLATRETFGSAAYVGMMKRIAEDGGQVKHCGVSDGPMIIRLYKESQDPALLAEKDIKPIMRDIDTLAQTALNLDASDIHIEKRTGYASVKLRINGRLEDYSDSWQPEYVLRMARALHTIADEDSKDVTFSPEGQLSVSRTLPVTGNRVKLRVQMSTAYPDEGLDIVIRVLRVAASAKVKPLSELGYAPEHIEMLDYMLSSPGGLTIVCGTTGSGKSTTLQTAMMDIRRSDAGLKLISVEDPPEYVLDGVTQIPVPRRRNASGGENPFVIPMRSTMRMDPDVIMVGEIRDAESAELLVAMVQSGHKALSTIHTDSALGVFGRLRSMGVDADVLGARSFISGLIYQTLVPVLCPHCKVDYDPSMTSIAPALHARIAQVVQPGDKLSIEAQNTADHPNNCPHCRGRGIIGRTVCAEMVIPDATILDCVRKNDATRAYAHWRSLKNGQSPDSLVGATALEHGLQKMRLGVVSPSAVESALGLLHDFSQHADVVAAETGDLLGLAT